MRNISIKHLTGAALLLGIACQSTLTGNEGNFQFSYDADDWITDFNKPIAVGAYLDITVREVGTFGAVDLTLAEYDDPNVLTVDSFGGNLITVQGTGEGLALLQVEGTTNSGEALTDSVNMQAKVPEVMVLWHSCGGSEDGYYLTDQRVWVPFEMQMSNSQPVIGYGYYPIALDGEAAALDSDDSNQQWMAFDTAATAGVLALSSEIDDTTLTMNVAAPGDIDGVQDPIASVAEDIDVGDINAFYVRPMVGDLPVCQAEVEKTVTSLTPTICTVTDSDPEEDTGEGQHEYGWFTVEGVAEGTCQYEVTYPDANGGEGVTDLFEFTIEP